MKSALDDVCRRYRIQRISLAKRQRRRSILPSLNDVFKVFHLTTYPSSLNSYSPGSLSHAWHGPWPLLLLFHSFVCATVFVTKNIFLELAE